MAEELENEKDLYLDGECEFEVFKSCCQCCYHLTDKENKHCKAFPDGIPPEIWNRQVNHVLEYQGDHGIQYMNKTKMHLYGEECDDTLKE